MMDESYNIEGSKAGIGITVREKGFFEGYPNEYVSNLMGKIAEYELFEMPPRWLFLKLETTGGVVGWDEPVAEGRAHSVRAAVGEPMDNYVLGTNPAAIEDHWQAMYRRGFYRGGPVLVSAIAGIDQALWDIKEKHFGTPVHELLGGATRDRMRVYQRVGGDRPSEVAEQAELKIEAGLIAVRVNVTAELERIDMPAPAQAAVNRLEEVREAAGPEINIGVDFRGRVSKPMAKRLAKAPEPYEPMFIEEPILPEHNNVFPEIVQHTTIPIATSKQMYSHQDFRQVLEDGAADLVQLDLSHVGGITEVKKVVSMAEAYGVAFAPHYPLGPIALASYFQVDTCSPNALIQEQSLNIHYNQRNDVLDYFEDKSVFEYGNDYVAVPDEPGLRIQMDEQHIREQAERPVNWYNPV